MNPIAQYMIVVAIAAVPLAAAVLLVLLPVLRSRKDRAAESASAAASTATSAATSASNRPPVPSGFDEWGDDASADGTVGRVDAPVQPRRAALAIVLGALGASVLALGPLALGALNPPSAVPTWTDQADPAPELPLLRDGAYVEHDRAAQEYVLHVKRQDGVERVVVPEADAVLVVEPGTPARYGVQQCALQVPGDPAAWLWFPACGERTAIIVPEEGSVRAHGEAPVPADEDGEQPAEEVPGFPEEGIQGGGYDGLSPKEQKELWEESQKPHLD